MDQHARAAAQTGNANDFPFEMVDNEVVEKSSRPDEPIRDDSEGMSHEVVAVINLAAGLIVGIGGDVMLNRRQIGLSFLLFIVLSVGAALGTARLTRTAINARNLWLIAPMLFFAGMVAVRADSNMIFVNVLMALYLGAMGLFYMCNSTRIDEDTIREHNSAVVAAGFWSMVAPFAMLPAALGFFRGALQNRESGKTWLSIARGLMIAVPLLMVFAVLFISADAVFARMIDTVWQAINLDSFSSLVNHGFVAGAIGWVTAGGIAFGLARHRIINPTTTPTKAQFAPQAKPKKHPFTLGIIEAMIVLGMIDLLFGAFVLIQFAYFFGGVNTLQTGGLTYAEYARRGFFELMAVSGLTLGLVLWLDFVTIRSSARQKTLFRALSTALVALTSVILVSAANRMLLYEEAFGFTHLRVYVHVTIYWMGALFAAFLLSLYRVREHIFSLGTLIVIIGIAATLNLMNVDRYIAERNIARFENGAALDLAYLDRLSYDAAPELLAFYDRLPEGGEVIIASPESSYTLREAIGQMLLRDLLRLENNRDASIFAFNTAYAEAFALLDGARDRLPEYDPAYFTPSSSGYLSFDIRGD